MKWKIKLVLAVVFLPVLSVLRMGSTGNISVKDAGIFSL